MISVIMPTHNPDSVRFARALEGIASQTLPREQWELLVVDNGSSTPLHSDMLPPFARIVVEGRLGLTWARLAGVLASIGRVIVFVDDDNVLAPDFLAQVQKLMNDDHRLGAIGGKCLPVWQSGERPPAWMDEFCGRLALRDLGDRPIVEWWDGARYPSAAPVGAGMVVRRSGLESWISSVRSGSRLSDRRGKALTSGGDNDIVLHILKAGLSVGYFPELSVGHIIPPSRLTEEYLARLSRGINRSWIEVLSVHGIQPWPAALPGTIWLRMLRSYITHRAWRGGAAYVRWQADCGSFEGRAQLWRMIRETKERGDV